MHADPEPKFCQPTRLSAKDLKTDEKNLALSQLLWYSETRRPAFSIVVLLVSLPESEKGDQMPARILFLCARGSGRALLAASLLQSMAGNRFEIWSTPTQDTQEHALIGHILQEQRVALLPPDRLTQPAFGLRWDEGIILCSGLTDT